MDKEKRIIRLITQIDSIKAHVNRLKKSGYNVHTLDVDMLRQKTTELYEQILELEYLIPENEITQKKDSPVAENMIAKIVVDNEDPIVIEEHEIIEKEEIIDETEIIEPDVTVEQVPVVEPIIVQSPVVQEELEIKVAEPVIAPTTSVEKEIETIADDISENEEMDQTQPQQTTYDLFSGNTESPVAEKFQVSEEQSIAERMQRSSISNIREAIGINEKFLFINELFNGDLGRYNKILDDINELPTKKGVDTYLLELKIQFQWADENEAYIMLKELLDRKFS